MSRGGGMRERLAGALAAAGVAWGDVGAYEELDGGTFNTVFRVRRSGGGAGIVVKLAPGADVPVLRYEEGILGTEAWFYEVVRDGAVGVPTPVALAPATAGHLVMSECAGRPWSEVGEKMSEEERRLMRGELGTYVAGLHALEGDGFGYPARSLGPLRGTWREAFLGMVDAILLDAERFGVALPRPVDEVRELFAGHGALLDEVTVPRLVHFDLWDGNILVEDGHVSALIDAERAFWGDPLAEFVSLALFGDIERDEDFLAGYRAAGGPAVIDEGGRRRLALYQAYLYLIMWVEVAPRGYDAGRVEWLRRQVVEPLGLTLDGWARR
ncbi:aminoglycoside phosphotransferase family protein [Streptomyces sp. NPDC046716]|uniref:phosphotransferase family protein n=1 Tax=Streptomyces sp. NPDC046716 TaxID=3157093 RepID=UPI0033C05A1A